MSAHSSVVGGSNADRILNCPGSQPLILTIPDVVDQPSPEATEGSAMHAAMFEILVNEKDPRELINTTIPVKDEGEVIVTQELFHDCLEPAVAYYDELDAELGDDAVFLIEKTCQFPGIPGAFGTADLIAWSPAKNRTHVTDWKMGVGEAVFATYPEGEDEERINEQLLYYACAARHSHPEMFGDRTGDIVLTIVQPRPKDGPTPSISSTTVTHAELTAFESDLTAAVLAGKLPNPPMALGKWCRWCVAKTICPLKRKPVLELSNVVRIPAREEPSYQDLLLFILDVAGPLEDLIKEARDQAKALLQANQPLEGWKLVPARANRTWDALEAAVIRFMRKHGVKKAQLYKTEFVSPHQAEKLLPRGVKLPPQILKQESKSVTLAKASDRRPAVPSIAAIGKLLAGIKERA